MPMTYMPIMNLKTVGVSNYRADFSWTWNPGG
jgi:hypothetical protein